MESGLFCVGERMTNVYRRIKSEFFSAGGRMVNIYLSIEWFVLRGWSYCLCDNIMVSVVLNNIVVDYYFIIFSKRCQT